MQPVETLQPVTIQPGDPAYLWPPLVSHRLRKRSPAHVEAALAAIGAPPSWRDYVLTSDRAYLALFYPVSGGTGWVAPIGIPAPDWGGSVGNPIDAVAPARPADWSSEVAHYYYVDLDSGTDSGRTYGTPTAPRLTMPAAASVAAGSRIEVTGTSTSSQIVRAYTGTNGAWVAGTSGPVWVVADPDSAPLFHGELIYNGSYCIIDGITNERTAGNVGGLISFRTNSSATPHHCCLRNATQWGQGIDTANDPTSIVGDGSSTWAHDIVLYNNLVHDIGNWQSSAENDSHGVSVGALVYNLWIVDCEIYHCGGDSVQLNAGSSSSYNDYLYNVYIGRNEFYENLENAIDIKACKDIIVSENLCYNIYDSVSANGEICVLHYGCDSIWFLANTFHTGVYGVNITGATNVHFVGNLIYDVSSYGINAYGNSNYDAVDNTLYNYATGLHTFNANSQGCRFSGNILAGRNSADGYEIWVENNGSYHTIDRNLYHKGTQANVRFSWNNTAYTSLAAWKSASSQDANAVEDDPDFVSAGSNFRLQSGSPAIGMGTEHAIYDAFLADVGVSIQYDRAGLARPQGGAWDAGAYEYEFQGGTGTLGRRHTRILTN